MRIGMMADLYKPHISGVTNHIALNKRILEHAGHEVFVFTFGDANVVDDEPNVVCAPGIPLAETGAYLSFRYPRRVRRQLQSVDVVHAHHPFLSARLAIRYCRPYNIPVLCIAANKMKGVYASICHDTYSAAQGVLHDDMNVLCLGGRVIGPELAKTLISAFLNAEYQGNKA